MIDISFINLSILSKLNVKKLILLSFQIILISYITYYFMGSKISQNEKKIENYTKIPLKNISDT